jgi:hypothetical protein
MKIGTSGDHLAVSIAAALNRKDSLMHTSPLLTAALVSAWLGVAPLPAQTTVAFHLVKTASYGWPDIPAGGSLSVNDRQLQGGMLGSVNGTVEGRDGSIYALDLVNKKVVMFDAKGTFIHAFGGSGEGPGEFRRPSRISKGPDGSIYVWDPALRRISRFTPAGKNSSQTTVQVSSLIDFAVIRDRAWFVRAVIAGGAPVVAVDLGTGMAVDSFATLTKEEVGISGFGAPGSLTSNKAGEVVFAGPFPISLRVWSNGTVRVAGSNRFPDAQGYVTQTGVRMTPVSMRGIAGRPDGTYAAVYSVSGATTEGTRSSTHYYVEILDPNGKTRGRVELQGVDLVAGIAAAANGDLLISVTSDYPQVWRMRVVSGAN